MRGHGRPLGVVAPLLLLAAIGLAVVGCGADATELTSSSEGPQGAATSVADPLAMSIRAADDGTALLLDDGVALHVLDPATAGERFVAPAGIASGDGSLVVGAEANGVQTVVTARSVVDGSTRWTASVDGTFELAGVSRAGETVALTNVDEASRSTTFVVVRFAFVDDPVLGDARTVLPPAVGSAPLPSSHRYEVTGVLEFDGFADRADGIFVLQRSDVDDDAYRVRYLDLAMGTLHNMGTRDKTIPEGAMYGRFRSVLTSPGRHEIATLYTVEGSGSSGAAFIHLLNTGGNYADCLDLPAPLGRGEPSTLALAAIPSGDPLLVYDSQAGAVAAFDPDELGAVTVFETSDPALAQGRPAAIAATRNEVVVASGELVVVHDLLGAVMTSWSAGGAVTGLAAIPDSSRFVAIVDGAVRLFDRDGTPVGSVEPAEAPTTTDTAAPETTAPPTASPAAPPTSVVDANVDANPVPTDGPAVVGTVPQPTGNPGTSRP